MYCFGRWWKWKIYLIGFVYRVVRVLKALWIFFFFWNHPVFWENCIKLTFSGCPRKFFHRVMYIPPSSGHISLNFIMPFEVDSNEVWCCFLMSGVRMLYTFLKDWWNFIQIHQYYTMALICYIFMMIEWMILLSGWYEPLASFAGHTFLFNVSRHTVSNYDHNYLVEPTLAFALCEVEVLHVLRLKILFDWLDNIRFALLACRLSHLLRFNGSRLKCLDLYRVLFQVELFHTDIKAY